MENKLKICIVSREYPPDTLWGGIGTFTYNLAQGLKEIGHDVDVISFSLHNDSHTDDNGVNIYRINSPRVPYTQKSWWDFATSALSPFALFYSFKVMKKIKELNSTKRYDVVDLPEHIGEGFFTLLKQMLPSTVRLYTPLSLISHMGLNISTTKLDYYFLRLLEKFSIKNATIVNSPSSALAKFVMREFNLKKKYEMIYNPIDTNTFAPIRHTETKDTVNVLFVGRLEDRKGVHVLAEAIPQIVKTVKAVTFTLLGNDCKGVNGYASMKQYMLEIFDRNGVSEHVLFHERVPYFQLPDVYNSADISVVPSLYDNSPYTCLEAMSCGLPVVGTSAGGMPEYIDDGVNGIIVPPNDVAALANAVVALVVDKDKREAFGKGAREKALREFKREEVAKKITLVYQQAISKF